MIEVPRETLALVQGYFDRPLPPVLFDVGSVRSQIRAYAPRSLRKGGVMSVTARAGGLRTIGVSTLGRITLDPSHYEPTTAAGIALIGHEEVHQQQYLDIADFDAAYAAADRLTPRDEPYLNPFELPAYQREREIYCDLVAQGVPPGSWLPLGVQLWGCEL